MDSFKHMGISLHLFTFVEKNSVVFPYVICTHQSNRKLISETDSLLSTTKSATSVRYTKNNFFLSQIVDIYQ